MIPILNIHIMLGFGLNSLQYLWIINPSTRHFFNHNWASGQTGDPLVFGLYLELGVSNSYKSKTIRSITQRPTTLLLMTTSNSEIIMAQIGLKVRGRAQRMSLETFW